MQPSCGVHRYRSRCGPKLIASVLAVFNFKGNTKCFRSFSSIEAEIGEMYEILDEVKKRGQLWNDKK